MSVQAGMLTFDDAPVDRGLLERIALELAPWGPNGHNQHYARTLAMLHRPFHVTEEDRHDTQPIVGPTGDVLTWDGRLDNRRDLAAELVLDSNVPSTDATIALAAYERWGVNCWRRLIGDWAVCVWDSRTNSLYLARDFVGARSLYYLRQTQRVIWCTSLAALVLAMARNSQSRFRLSDEYVAGYLVSHPDPRITPYREIRAVPPGGYVQITRSMIREGEYWELRSAHLRYRSDADYEAHFRTLLAQAVRRRLRTFAPVLADLSGGVDSSAIVCVAHQLMVRGDVNATMDTISRYDEEEPSGDERPYFTKVEEYIGKAGCHIDSARCRNPVPTFRRAFISRPGYLDSAYWIWSDLAELIARNGNRVHLSGFGGDELLGGVQQPVPQLAELLWSLRFGQFAEKLREWSLALKKPMLHLLWGAVSELFPAAAKPAASADICRLIRPWIEPSFYRCCGLSSIAIGFGGGRCRYAPGPVPRVAMQGHLAAFLADRRHPNPFASVDMTYPYLDQDLVEFLLSIPDEQLLRPHQRRSLMRRALRDVVPSEVLSRKTKALGQRSPRLLLLGKYAALPGRLDRIVSSGRFEEALKAAAAGRIQTSAPLLKTLSLLEWAHQRTSERILTE